MRKGERASLFLASLIEMISYETTKVKVLPRIALVSIFSEENEEWGGSQSPSLTSYVYGHTHVRAHCMDAYKQRANNPLALGGEMSVISWWGCNHFLSCLHLRVGPHTTVQCALREGVVTNFLGLLRLAHAIRECIIAVVNHSAWPQREGRAHLLLCGAEFSRKGMQNIDA